jgi:hypothetical protein
MIFSKSVINYTSLYHEYLQFIDYIPEHLSIYQASPELWKREAFEEEFDGAPDAAGEPGELSAGELCRLPGRWFFSAGVGLLA